MTKQRRCVLAILCVLIAISRIVESITLTQVAPIQLEEGSYVTLNASNIQITNSSASNYDISILPFSEASGYFANISRLDIELLSFTYGDIVANMIAFVSSNLSKPLEYRQPVRISDGYSTLDTNLNISATAMSVSSRVLPLGAPCVRTIDTTTDLSFPLSTDIVEITVSQSGRAPEVMVHIIQEPQHGSIKSQNSTETSPFSYSKIQNSAVTYTLLSSQTRVTQDSFQLQFSIGHGTSDVVTVPVCILPLPYPSLSQPGALSVPTMGESVIGPDILAATHDRQVVNGAVMLQYNISEPPRHGIITNMATGEESITTFTQADVDNHYILYENTRNVSVTDLTDRFSVKIRNQYYQPDDVYQVEISLHVANLETINEQIVVVEGANHIITPLELFAAAPKGYSVTIYILQQPQYGDLVLQRPYPAPSVPHTRIVQLEDIMSGYLRYIHDIDTEYPTDAFHFRTIATNVTNHFDSLEFESKFNITINLTNDNAPEESVLVGMPVHQGASGAITTDYLKFTDADYGYNDDDLVYQLKYGPFQGSLCLDDACWDGTIFPVEFEWTQGDMKNGRLRYINNGYSDNNDLIFFSITDGKYVVSEYDWRVFRFEVVALSAVRTPSADLEVLEGGTVNVTSDNIYYEANKQDVSPNSFEYTVTAAPTHGSLEFASGGSAGTFTQNDILTGNILYRHYGDDNTADSFRFTVTIDTFTSSEETLNIVITPVDDNPPHLVQHQRRVFVDVGDLVHLDDQMLEITDTDTDSDSSLIYIITTHPRHGILEKRATPSSDVYTNATTFTQLDLQEMNVRYYHRSTLELLDSFSFTISDGTNSPSNTYTMDFVIVGQIDVTIHGLMLMEGEEKAIPRSSIEIHHPYFATANVLFDITILPHNGTILTGGSCGQTCLFHSSDLDHGLVKYAHDGSETTYDFFRFRIELTSSRYTQMFSYPIIISSVNDQELRIVKNSSLVVWASQTTPITPQHLLTTDPDTPPSKILYQFHLSPVDLSDGYFASVDNLNVSKATFVQEEINNGSLVFVDKHIYDDTRILKFEVTDGRFTKNGTFTILATVLRIQRVNSQELDVDMGGAVKLQVTNLKVFTNMQDQDQPSSVVFNVMASPQYGRLVDSMGNDVTTFNQSDVESLTYVHSAVNVWEAVDYINLTASHPYSLQPKPMSLVVNIALLENDHSPFVALQGLSLLENAKQCLNQSNLDARNVHYYAWKESSTGNDFANTQLEYRVISLPLHGTITVNGSIAVAFTHSDVVAGDVCYHNNGDEEESDRVVIEARVSGSGGLIHTVSDTLPVQVQLYNDEKPVLISTNLHKDFVRGFPLAIDLMVSDADTSPEEIVYTITRPSPMGSLQVNGLNASSFTQADIDNDIVQFMPTDIGSSSFTFQYSDPDFKSDATEFTVSISEHYLELVPNSQPLTYAQIQSEAVLSKAILDTMTNGDRAETMFVVTKSPLHGSILLSEKEVTSFSQLDVDQGLVVYRQTDNGNHQDNLTLIVSNRMKTVPDITVDILVEMYGSTVNSYHLPPTMSQPLPAGVIDLSDLEHYSILSPNIELTSDLKYGYLSFGYPNRKVSTTPISSFDYHDLQSQHVYYTWKQSPDIDPSVNYTEVFSGLIKLDGIPPGMFSFSLTLQPPTSAVLPSKPTTVVQPTDETEPTTPGTDSSPDAIIYQLYVPIIGLLVVMVIAALIFVIFCCTQSKRIKRKLRHKTGLDLTSKKHPASRGPSPRMSPTRPFNSPPIHAGDLDADSMDSESSSAADIMMMHTNQQTQQVMTISANHTQLPHTGHSSSGYYTQGPMTPYSDADSYCVSPAPYQQGGEDLQDARWISLSPTRMDGQMHFTRSTDIRATSPVRRASNFKKSAHLYNSLSTVSGGATAVPKGYQFSSLRGRDQIKDSVSSLGYESSNTQDSVSQRQSVVSTTADPSPADKENPNEMDAIQTAPPVLEDCEYWV